MSILKWVKTTKARLVVKVKTQYTTILKMDSVQPTEQLDWVLLLRRLTHLKLWQMIKWIQEEECFRQLIKLFLLYQLIFKILAKELRLRLIRFMLSHQLKRWKVRVLKLRNQKVKHRCPSRLRKWWLLYFVSLISWAISLLL